MGTQAVDTTIRIAFGLVHGLLLAMALPLLYMAIPATARAYPLAMLLLVIPIISFVWGFGLSAFSQYIYCGTVSLPQVALVSTFAPAFVIFFSTIVYFLPFFRSPVEAILPVTADVDMKYALGFSFFLLWAGIYGQNVGSGLLQACPK
jgi:hypothetical protein